MTKQLIYGLIGWTLIGGTSCLSTGCSSTPKSEAQRQGSFERQLAGLRAANFSGEVYMESGGSPLGFSMSNVFALGPQQMTLRANGKVDFTRPAPGTFNPIPTEVLAAFHRRLAALEGGQP